MDAGLCDGNYFDYEDDETALQREADIATEILDGECWVDPAFPADGRALYFDPECPPKGSMPPESLSWFRICQGGVDKCNDPKTFMADETSCVIIQGALGDTYFINSLRLLACDPKYIDRLVVSDKYAKKGLYTFKFCKVGKWRYVHVDDRIPCRQSGRVHFSRNGNPNETFAMLMEKAYAKLHGCYESLLHGLVEKALQDLTPAAHVQVHRKELMSPDEVYDIVWEDLDAAIEEKRVVGCRRVAADPFSDKNQDRLGIKLGVAYQVVDVCAAHAEATGIADALDVGLVCIRNLQSRETGGRFTGRWSYGHPAWSEYPEIGRDLAARTEEVHLASPFHSGDKKSIVSVPSEDVDKSSRTKKKALRDMSEDPDDPFADVNLSDSDEEEDNFAIDKVIKSNKVKVAQPGVEGLYWLQIEDFVELFNRVYIVQDVSWGAEMTTKRYLSKWIPGDFIAGSGGPPIDTGLAVPSAGIRESDDKEEASVGGDGDGSVDDKEAGDGDGEDDEDEESEEEVDDDAPPDPFTDNPMYPFVVSEPTILSVALFQSDCRWSVSRIGVDNPMAVTTKDFAVRGGRLDACMSYHRAIGFVIVKLSGLKVRVTTFSMKRIVANSEYIQFSNCCSKVVHLAPGRYAVVPFTDVPVDNMVIEYCLTAQFKAGAVDFEINDIIKERPMDDMPSDDEAEGDEEERRRLQGEGSGRCPLLLMTDRWEWEEEIEESGSIAVYEQVNDLAFLLRSMRKDVRDLQREKLKMMSKDKKPIVEPLNKLSI
mmetsp:Transcript_2824/g.4278  ORF Transcript_2824/g.4278 Transcript_2824/m.4278 type:complete len:766 (+) Transcript_2824:144-2441(+)